jgi:hypothetical protein
MVDVLDDGAGCITGAINVLGHTGTVVGVASSRPQTDTGNSQYHYPFHFITLSFQRNKNKNKQNL